MSNAGAQTVSLLVIVLGLMKAVDVCKLSEENKSTVLYTMDVAEHSIINFPIDNDSKSKRSWIESGVAKFDIVIRTMVDVRYTAPLLSSMCVKIMTDLTERIKDESKLGMLLPVLEAVNGLHDAVDPDGLMYDAYDDADSIITQAYSIFGFVPLE